MSKSNPISWAIAGRWSILLVEQPSAMSTASAFRTASFVIMSLGRMFCFSRSITAMPACFARRRRSEYTAGTVPFPFNPMPRASVRQFMELAVYIPEQEPQVGHAFSSNSHTSSSVMVPAAYEPTASNMEDRLVFFPFTWPASIGPPDTNTVGTLILAAAIRSPGTFLSQLGTITSASN